MVQFGTKTGPTFPQRFLCRGDELSILECQQGIGDGCDQDAAMQCLGIEEPIVHLSSVNL